MLRGTMYSILGIKSHDVLFFINKIYSKKPYSHGSSEADHSMFSGSIDRTAFCRTQTCRMWVIKVKQKERQRLEVLYLKYVGYHLTYFCFHAVLYCLIN